jgi:hypothetical protein
MSGFFDDCRKHYFLNVQMTITTPAMQSNPNPSLPVSKITIFWVPGGTRLRRAHS